MWIIIALIAVYMASKIFLIATGNDEDEHNAEPSPDDMQDWD